VRLLKKPGRPDKSAAGEILEVVERATRQFVGTYFERDGEGYVRVDGTVFSHSIYVGDPGAKGARPEDKVVFEMARFPSAEDRGEGVITEILGPRGQPGVDTLSVIKAFGLPEEFPDEALQEARKAASHFKEKDLGDLVHDAEGFARRHPDLFLGGSLIAGVLVARFLKSSAERRGGDGDGDSYGRGREDWNRDDRLARGGQPYRGGYRSPSYPAQGGL